MPNDKIPANPTVKMLNQEHADFTDVKEDWVKLGWLYEGGRKIKKNATQFLTRRPKELQEVYQARVDRFSYHNIIGTCFGWYRAAMFKNPPTIDMNLVDADGEVTDAELPKEQSCFYADFRKDCDKKKSSFVDVLREMWTNLALYKMAYVLVDNPRADSKLRSKADQRAAGVLDKSGKPSPYLVVYDPKAVINWETDVYGNLEWVVIALQESRRSFAGETKTVDTWLYYDKENFARYERERKPDETSITKIDDEALVTRVDFGAHALTAVRQVPLLKFEVPDGLWLANRAYLPTLDHLNSDNAYGWALFMANLCMPVIKSDQDIKPTLSEAGFIQLPENASYEWSEPEGRSFATSAERVAELREEIFRAMYLTYQGRDSTATADGTSGVSKEMDMMPAQDVMNEYGDVVITAAQITLDAVAQARGDKQVRSDVRGLKFGKSATLESIQKTEEVIALAIPSATFEKEVYVQAANEYFPDMNAETADKIREEIESAPTNEEKLQAEKDDRKAQYSDALDSAVQQYTKVSNAKGAPPSKEK